MNFQQHVEKLREKGLNTHAIADELNAKGITSPTGKKVTHHIVNYALYGKSDRKGAKQVPVVSYQRVTALPPEQTKNGLAVAIVGSADEIARIVKGLMA